MNGDGVPQDSLEAYMWFTLAAAQSSGEDREGYVKGRNNLVERMTAEQIAEGQRRVREWTSPPRRDG